MVGRRTYIFRLVGVVLLATFCINVLALAFNKPGYYSAVMKAQSRAETSPPKPTRPVYNLAAMLDVSRRLLFAADHNPGGLIDRIKGYEPIITVQETLIFRDLLGTFVEACDRVGAQYFMWAGTLVGSYLNHGMIPWDDDVDLCVDLLHKETLRRELLRLSPEYVLVELPRHSNLTYWKLHHGRHSQPIPPSGFNYKYPNLDIFFYEYNSTTLWRTVEFSFDVNLFLPFVKRPYWDLTLNAPRNTYGALIARNYDLNVCICTYWSHKNENIIGCQKRIDCSPLKNLYPFVTRIHTPQGVNETLLIGNKTVGWFLEEN